MMIPVNYVDVPMPMQYYVPQYQQPNYVPYYQQQQHFEQPAMREEIYTETHSVEEFCAELKLAEKSKGYRAAIRFAQQYIAQSPPRMQWKMFLELAELSRVSVLSLYKLLADSVLITEPTERVALYARQTLF